jgi:TonB-linked SusC/RagA family outer membrane protein
MRKTLRTLFCLPALLAAPLLAASAATAAPQAAQGTITGQITDEAGGQPLVGVQVTIEDSNLSTLSNAEGIYELTGVAAGDVVVRAGALGYATAEQTVTVRSGETTTANFSLSISALALDELVVVGYGAQQRATLTGSIATVSGDVVAVSPAPNLTTSLAGRLPGLTVLQRSGTPGSENLNIMIRGQGTYRQEMPGQPNPNNPLIIIDGVERDGLQRLNPEDVESVTVLKDASAAIYGARAANGVILIETKRGAAGAPVFEVSFESAFATPTHVPNMMDAGTFAEFFNEARWYDAGLPDPQTWTAPYSANAITRFRDGSDPVLYPNTDWPGVSFRSRSLQRNVGIRASGGTEAVRYRVSFGYTDQNTDLRNNPNHHRRYNLRTVLDAQLTDNLSVGANLAGTVNQTVGSGGTDGFTIFLSNPTLAAVYPNGLLAGGRFGNSSLLADQRGRNETENVPLYSSFTAAYEAPFLDGLRFDASFNYDLRNSFQKNWNTPHMFHEFNPATGEYQLTQSEQTTISLTDTYQKETRLLTNFRATYTNTFSADHNVSLMMGGEQQRDNFWLAEAYRRNFVSQAISQINAGSTNPEDKDNSGFATESAYNNLFGRLNYDFQSKYLVEFLFRYDGSPTFPQGRRYGFFPSASLGWRLSEERFFQDRFPFLNELKLRASVGTVGSDAVGNFQYLQAFGFTDNDGNPVAYPFGGTDAPGLRSGTLPNPDITWEESVKTDVGLEAELWNGGLGVDLTYWTEHRTGILSAPQLAVSRVFGFPALPDLNIGETKSRGFELVLSHARALTRDFSYHLSGNVAYARNRIVYLDEVPPAEPYQAQEGNPVGAGLFYVSDGIFQTQEELDAYPSAPNARVGDIRIVDMNGDGVINADDRVRWNQSATPDYIVGLNTGFRYRNLDFQAFFQGQTGAVIYDGVQHEAGHTDGRNTWTVRAQDRWSVDNPNGTMPRAGQFTTSPGATDFFLHDATFMRLKTLEVGFTLPERIMPAGVDRARIYLSGFNVLTWAKELKWMDPELIQIDNDAPGMSYPPQRILNMGFDVTF